MSSGEKWFVVGIDPAPTKPAILCTGETEADFTTVQPNELRQHIEELLKCHARVLIAWDAPLSFCNNDFYDRAIDRAVRHWIKTRVDGKLVANKAISARSFAGLPHWAISCYSLGYPFGSPPGELKLTDRLQGRHCLVEVHPAVAMGMWWIEKDMNCPFKSYKQDKSQTSVIAAVLGFPAPAGSDDDHLDAYVAYKLGLMYTKGRAGWAGSVRLGGYVLPNCSSKREIESLITELTHR